MSPSPQPAPTAQTTRFQFQQRCDQAVATGGEKAPFTGTLLLRYADQPGDVWAATGTLASKRHLLSLDTNTRIGLSPSRDHLLIRRVGPSDSKFSIFDLDAGERRDFQWRADWPAPEQSGLRWIEQDQIALFGPEGEVLILSASSGEVVRRLRLPSLPDANDGSYAFSSVNDSLDRLAYLDDQFRLAMRDVASGKEVTRIEVEMDSFNFPSWSPDGSLFVFEGFDPDDATMRTSEIYVVNKNGRGGRITDASSSFSDYEVLLFSWAPNNRYVGMWVKAAQSGAGMAEDRWWLQVLDTQSDVLYDYCLSLTTEGFRWTSFDILWSPDSTQLYAPTHDTTPGILLDIQTGAITELPVGANVVAWGW